jgi:hypothetical protein
MEMEGACAEARLVQIVTAFRVREPELQVLHTCKTISHHALCFLQHSIAAEMV